MEKILTKIGNSYIISAGKCSGTFPQTNKENYGS